MKASRFTPIYFKNLTLLFTSLQSYSWILNAILFQSKQTTMKKWAVVISAVGLVCAVSGCGGNYVMATKDSCMILTDGKAKVDDKTGLVSYAKGNETQINRDDVSQIIER